MSTERESWLFSFGHGHAFPNGFIELEGDYSEARNKMVELFDVKWAFQYPSSDKEKLIGHNMEEVVIHKGQPRYKDGV